ncbi:hypothetical protein Tco_1074481 [Tanacetum coccineum]
MSFSSRICFPGEIYKKEPQAGRLFLISSSGWPFVSAVLGMVTHFAANLTLNSASFLPSILLLVVIIVVVVIVVAVIVVVVVVIIMNCALLPDSLASGLWRRLPLKFEALKRIWANGISQKVNASSVRVPVANFTLQSSVQLLRENTDLVCSNQRIRLTSPSVPLKLKVFAMVAACASRAAATLSATSCLMRPETWLVLQMLIISSRRKKSQESNSGDSGNTGDEGKTVGGAIGACSSGIGEMASEVKRYLVKSSEGLGEMFPGEAGK